MRRTIELALGPVLLCAAAAALGSVALFAVAVGLGLLYAGAQMVVTRGAERLVVVRKIDRVEVVEGNPITVLFEIEGLAGLPAEVELMGTDGVWHGLPMGRSSVRYVINQPGEHLLEPSPMRVRDDLGLITRFVVVGEPETVLVLPEPTRMVSPPRQGSAARTPDPEPEGLRTYVPGTPVSRIHWKSAARGGELQERSFTTSVDQLPLVVVDTAAAAGPPALDWTARVAAGYVVELVRDGGCRVLLPGDRTPITLTDAHAQWPALHRRLAELRVGSPAPFPGTDLQGALVVSAAQAPPEALVAPGPLPPGITATRGAGVLGAAA
ncbi:MAG: DUF58 domain-containing protein [Solirubrobacteraceae bacterium]|nr:DUF58 domain-containing protein [Solirubrobacteraceae bacterium]